MAAAKKKKGKNEGKKTVVKGGSSFGKIRGILILLILIVLAGGIGFSYVPENKVPEKLQSLYLFCLRSRNTVIARTGLPLQRYEDTVVIHPEDSPEIPVYFAPSERIAQGLCEFLSGAKSTLDVCIYDLDLNEVADALIKAQQSGVEVRVVVDSDNRKLLAVDRLVKAGIPVTEDHRATIMHHKFVVADAKRVWTGSFNFTENGKKRNDNNALIIESPDIAACYMSKFNEYADKKFSTEAQGKTARNRFFMGKVPVAAAFSPSDSVAKMICQELSYANKEVQVMAFVLTSEPIAEKLGELAKRGVKVQCLLDSAQAKSRYSRDQYLLGCGVKIAISPNTTGKMHHKVIIIDGETVITGSYNFSESAETGNDENILLLKNEALAKLYQKEFQRCLNGTKGY